MENRSNSDVFSPFPHSPSVSFVHSFDVFSPHSVPFILTMVDETIKLLMWLNIWDGARDSNDCRRCRIKPERKLYAKFIKLVCDSIFSSELFFSFYKRALPFVSSSNEGRNVRLQLKFVIRRRKKMQGKKARARKANQMSFRCRLSPCAPHRLFRCKLNGRVLCGAASSTLAVTARSLTGYH